MAKPSVQTRFVLDAMAAERVKAAENWERALDSLENMNQRLGKFAKVQRQLVEQSEVAAQAAKQAAKERSVLSRQVEESGQLLARVQLESMAAETEKSRRSGSTSPSSGSSPPVQVRKGPQKGVQINPLPEMSFPKFDGANPSVWLDKCLYYFHIFKVSEAMWVQVASLHLEGIAARWFHVHKLKQRTGEWNHFSRDVLNKFGADEYPKAMRRLMGLRQTGSLDEFVRAIEEARYMVSLHNPKLGEVLFVTQFIKGLEYDLQGAVQSQMPTTLDGAVLIAKMQDELNDQYKGRSTRSVFQSRSSSTAVKAKVISGTTDKGCMKVRGLLKNKVTLLLSIHSGSPTCFINKNLVARARLSAVSCPPARFTLANGESLTSDLLVPQLAWCANGHTFHTDMRVLDLGPYDAILGYDWLKSHSPMECDWANKVLVFHDAGVEVTLKGDDDNIKKEVQEVSTICHKC
jgi:hypothetical protein